MNEIKGAMSPEVRSDMQRWFNQRDWNFRSGFYATGVACAVIAERIFCGWFYRGGINDDV
jgi:hypothetical protein